MLLSVSALQEVRWDYSFSVISIYRFHRLVWCIWVIPFQVVSVLTSQFHSNVFAMQFLLKIQEIWNKFDFHLFHVQNIMKNCLTWITWNTTFLSSFVYGDSPITKQNIHNFSTFFYGSYIRHPSYHLLCFMTPLYIFLPLINLLFLYNISAKSLLKHLHDFTIFYHIYNTKCNIISLFQELKKLPTCHNAILRCTQHLAVKPILAENWDLQGQLFWFPLLFDET